MGKLKSHSGAKKRVRKTGTGKFAMKRNSRNHLLQQKNKKAKRQNRTLVVDKRDEKALRALLPHL
jgi:large subunit ribosomal protein L35